MLLPDNIHPKNTLYYNGAMVLRALKALGEADLIDLLMKCREQQDMPLPLLVLSIDWLFLAERVKRNENGNFVLCS